MNKYKLLTPGPLTTSDKVRQAMDEDRCTWDTEYKSLTQYVRSELLDLAGVSHEDYSVVLMQGSGSFGVEATLTSAIGNNEKCLFIVNGAYGKRMAEMASYMDMDYEVYDLPYNQKPDMEVLRGLLRPDITHLAMVHCETTTGMLNPVEAVGNLCQELNICFILDAMSSFGGIQIDMNAHHINFLVSSANKCIQGVPGFSFVIARKEDLASCQGKSKSLVLDLYDQWQVMNKDGKWRYTSPTHVVAAFAQAINDLKEEGGISARQSRYQANNDVLRFGMAKLGFEAYIKASDQSPIITTFKFPNDGFDFNTFYTYVKERGYILYPGKLTNEDTFRVGNIGEIYPEDMSELLEIIQGYMEV